MCVCRVIKFAKPSTHSPVCLGFIVSYAHRYLQDGVVDRVVRGCVFYNFHFPTCIMSYIVKTAGEQLTKSLLLLYVVVGGYECTSQGVHVFCLFTVTMSQLS